MPVPSWHTLHLDAQYHSECSLSWTIYVSPEVHAFLKLSDEGDFFQVKWSRRRSSSSSQREIYAVALGPFVRKNCIALGQNVKSLLRRVQIRVLHRTLSPLRTITITSFQRSSKAQDLSALSSTLDQLLGMPVQLGKNYTTTSFGFRVTHCEPFSFGGRVGPETQIRLECPRYSSSEDRTLRLTNHIVRFSLSGGPTLDLPQALLSKASRHNFTLQEIPLDYARFLAEIVTDQDVCLGSCLFANCSNYDFDDQEVRLCQLTTEDDTKYILLPLVPSSRISDNRIYITGSLWQLMASRFGDHLARQRFQINLLKGNGGEEQEVKLQFAKKVEISFLGTPAYSELPSKLVDNLLKAYFAEPKYIFTGQIVEVPLSIYAKELGRGKCFSSVYFKVLSVDTQKDERLGALASVTETNLFQKSFIQERFPPRYYSYHLKFVMPQT